MVHLGTVGFGYKQWNGVFYPAGMKPASYLSFYANYFNSVEIDSSFYGTPRATTVDKWARSVPDAFTFCPKTPQQITHDNRLHNMSADMSHFVETMNRLGTKLGPILIQLPPDFTTAERSALDPFLDQLPQSTRYAVEFRHLSWEQSDINKQLRERNIGRVSADYVIMPKTVHITADFVYLRFLGRHGRYATKDKELWNPTAELSKWHAQLNDFSGNLFGYFNNDYSGYSPEACLKFKQMLGLSAELPQNPVQGSLF
ncbi:MAG: hypothetical protein ACI9EW_000418 [Cellvibrionaceae bacterium]|jgi:uncharacterized protein YecE (DUF72 family)